MRLIILLALNLSLAGLQVSWAQSQTGGFNPQAADPYSRLGLTTLATQSDIKKAYQKAALLYHPDRASQIGLSEKQATEAFQRIKESYEILSGKGKSFFAEEPRQPKPDLLPNNEVEIYQLISREYEKAGGSTFDTKAFANVWRSLQKTYLLTENENPAIGDKFKKVWDDFIKMKIQESISKGQKYEAKDHIIVFNKEIDLLLQTWSLKSQSNLEGAYDAAIKSILLNYEISHGDIKKTRDYAEKVLSPELSRLGMDPKALVGYGVFDALASKALDARSQVGSDYLLVYLAVTEISPETNRFSILQNATSYNFDNVSAQLYKTAKQIKSARPDLSGQVDEWLFQVRTSNVDRTISQWLTELSNAYNNFDLETWKRLSFEAQQKDSNETGLVKHGPGGNKNFQIALNQFLESQLRTSKNPVAASTNIAFVNRLADPDQHFEKLNRFIQQSSSTAEVYAYLSEAMDLASFLLTMENVQFKVIKGQRPEYAKWTNELLTSAQKNEESRMGKKIPQIQYWNSLLELAKLQDQNGDYNAREFIKNLISALAASPTYDKVMYLQNLLQVDAEVAAIAFGRQAKSGMHKMIKQMNEKMKSAPTVYSLQRSLVVVAPRCEALFH